MIYHSTHEVTNSKGHNFAEPKVCLKCASRGVPALLGSAVQKRWARYATTGAAKATRRAKHGDLRLAHSPRPRHTISCLSSARAKRKTKERIKKRPFSRRLRAAHSSCASYAPLTLYRAARGCPSCVHSSRRTITTSPRRARKTLLAKRLAL